MMSRERFERREIPLTRNSERDEALLTVIVPVYNVENYIEECLASLVKQENTRLKIIVINDGSQDASGEICTRYQRCYPQMITYIEQTNSGLGAARNVGLRKTISRYVTFLDGDDWYLDGAIDQALKAIEAHSDCDIFFTLPQIYYMSDETIHPWYDADKLRRIKA